MCEHLTALCLRFRVGPQRTGLLERLARSRIPHSLD
jgi:hypothetical protein